MWRKLIMGIIGLLLGSASGFILCLLIGAVIGGNFMTAFQFYGQAGSEATGQIGALIGVLLGAFLGASGALKLARHRQA